MNEKTVGSQRVFNGKLLRLEVLEVELDGGRRARREIVRHPGAVAVWARVPDGRFVFVRQFRKAIEQELLEVVAGTRDAGETWEACARREIKEETGYTVKTLALLGSLFTAPGFCSEQIAIFYAELSNGGATDPDPDERLEVVLLDETEWKAMIARGAIQDAKTWAAWGLYETRRQMTEDGRRKTDDRRQTTEDGRREAGSGKIADLMIG
ncbi:MAG: NUDIX hydrolase [Lentisphaerae bacterium]|nr:NUDIX hydrolase [Lentisphaerota bacterium]